MLPLVLLAVAIAVIAAAGGTVVWLVLAGLLPPEVAAIGSTVVLLGSSLALAALVLRVRARRAERELHTVRRSQSIREREPLRYDLSDDELGAGEPDDEPDLVHSMPVEAGPARPSEDAAAFSIGDTALWLAPMVLMPSNETVAWRAFAGDRDGARGAADALPEDARSGAELRVIEAALAMSARLDEPLVCAVSAATLADDDASMELRRMVDASPARATRLILAADLAALDPLASGRLDDLIEEGLGLAVVRSDLATLDRSDAMAMAERGVGLALVPTSRLDPASATRPLRWLMDAGIEPVATDVPDEDAMLRAADLGIVRFSGPAFGAPRRARDGQGATVDGARREAASR